MRRFLLTSLVLALPLSMLPAQAAELGACSASTPRINPPPGVGVPPTGAPNWQPIATSGGCTATVQISEPTQVVAAIKVDPSFAGSVGLRVAGPNALFTQFSGTFANDSLIQGDESRTITLPVGTWRMDVYLTGPGLPGNNRAAVGTYGGSLSTGS